jgi:hypothetical protein
VREPGQDEDSITEAYVRFFFRLDEEEIDEIVRMVAEQVLVKDFEVQTLSTVKNEAFTLKRYLTVQNTIFYTVTEPTIK